MSKITMTKQTFRGSHINGESPLPSLSPTSTLQSEVKCTLPEGDPTFLGYGLVSNIYPYTQQDRYNRNLTDLETDVIILENKYLKAVFLPGYGGRLWQLWDKENNRDLLYTNDILRPSNLALRNAWISGGVEWNCGVVGHHPFTCSQMFTATYETDSMPVLRMYQWERIRNITYQMDFCLPDDARFLYARTRIHNPNSETVPVYWWSNTAVPEFEGGRIAVSADDAYVSDMGVVTREPFPLQNGNDISYPMNTRNQKDYFFYIPDDARKYEGHISTDGTGLIQASTSRLRGRKLFVWGQLPGSDTWQRFLTEKAGPYVEIQAGIGRTQYGCVPMQPLGTWEFAEVYGGITIDPKAQSAEYPVFLDSVEQSLENALPKQQLEDWLLSTVDSMGRFYVPAMTYGAGDAALENAIRIKTNQQNLNKWLDFGNPEPRHSDFEHLLHFGYMPSHEKDYVPNAFVSGRYWQKLLETAAKGPDRDNWLTWYHLGLVLFDTERKSGAESILDGFCALAALRHAADLSANGPVLYALAEVLINAGENKEASACAVKSCRLFSGDLSVAKDTMRILVTQRESGLALALYDVLPEDVRADDRIKFWHANALVLLDRCDEALELLERPDYIMTDFREGEMSINILWSEIVKRTGRTDLTLPSHLNFNAIPLSY
ncbi:MAG: DUF5107 domain-containing protein [Oscillospiraceae bacterium]|nr:DUF5107 domain-containing protein [Oscillospiraceae bacterium]